MEHALGLTGRSEKVVMWNAFGCYFHCVVSDRPILGALSDVRQPARFPLDGDCSVRRGLAVTVGLLAKVDDLDAVLQRHILGQLVRSVAVS